MASTLHTAPAASLDGHEALARAVVGADDATAEEISRATARQAHTLGGKGTHDDPIVIDWDQDGKDPESPYNWSRTKKLVQTYQIAFSTFCVSLGSSMYAGGARGIARDVFRSRSDIATLGISLYVLGFGMGPLLFAPLSEMYGRRRVYIFSWVPFCFAHLGAWFAKNSVQMLAFRLIAGTAGSAPLTGGGGGISDMFAPRERAYAMSLYTMMPFLGPILGPLLGGAIAETIGWRRIFVVLFCFAAVLAIIAILNMKETYTPVLLRRRAHKLHLDSGGQLFYISKYDLGKNLSLGHLLRINLSRPFVFLVTEPIVTLLTIYISLAYATLYSLFTSLPIVFQEHRGWGRSHGGVAYLGIGAGVLLAVAFVPFQAWHYTRACKRSPTGKAPPEARLFVTCLGAVLMPVGLFWFAWTCQPWRPAYISIIAGAPFGFGLFYLFTGVVAYIMDTYTIYCASAIAATVVLRSILAAIFPVFAPRIFARIGDQWALSIFAFLSLACMPIPLLFYKFGPRIRARSKHAAKLTGVAQGDSVAGEKTKTDIESGK